MSRQVVVIPTYNEIENIGGIVTAVISLKPEFDILIVDDNSPDGTGNKVKDLSDSFPNRIILEVRQEKSGLGTAYIHGFKKAIELGYDYIFEMDADFSHDPNDLLKLWKACEQDGYDLAVGSRYVSGVNVVNWPMGRMLMSYFASVYVRLVTGLDIADTTAGFKCYKREVLETINLDNIKFVGYAFQIEMKFIAWKYGFKIVEIPIIFTDRVKGQSKMSRGIFKEAVLGVIQMKIRSWFNYYTR
ncbi:MAG: polyprenol monophosphomannose synthase [Bacteroidota bacterium]